MILKLCMQHWGPKLYKVYINDDPGLTMIYFMAHSNLYVKGEDCYKVIKWEKLAAKD